ncbi:MAG: DUF1080 domain-containing protein [bacterium]|nr:DUF1080 domain-containing protein [bacterium]
MNSICRRTLPAALMVVAAVVCGLAATAGAQGVAPPMDLDEAALIAVVQGDADWLAKQNACRRLRQVGTAKSVPALAALLTDEKLSHMARYALEPMPCEEAVQALRDALATTAGMQKIGVITSLGAMRDKASVALLTPLLDDANADIAGTAAGALGRIATKDAVAALNANRGTPAVTEGLLTAAQRYLEAGKEKDAYPIYESLYVPDQPTHVRTGAFRGMAYARPKQAPEQLIAALDGKDALFRDLAAYIVGETPDAKDTAAYAKALPGLSPSGQTSLVRGLAARGDTKAREAVAGMLGQAHRRVQLEAIKALAVLGNSSNVPALVAAMGSDDADIAAAAQATFAKLPGKGVDAAAGKALADTTPAVRAELLLLLAGRRADNAISLALEDVGAADVDVRKASLRVLDLLGTEKEVPSVIVAMKQAPDASSRSAAEKALRGIASRCGQPALAAVLAGMDGADTKVRIGALGAVGQIGGPEALAVVVATLNDSDKDVQSEAVRVLSNWATLDAVPHLEQLAKSDDLSRQVLGLRGYIRLAGSEADMAKRAQMLTNALSLATRTDERKQALGGWGTVKTMQSLKVLTPFLDDAEVCDEASSALVSVAAVLVKQDAARLAASDALRAVVETCKNEDIRKNARKVMKDAGVTMSGAEILFNGKDLTGWKAEGGAAWSVESGCLVGRQGEKNAPGDLFTVREYGDFELVVEYKVQWPANSGVWFRYQTPQKAYQADILEYKDPVAHSGTIYCPGKMFLGANLDPSIEKKDDWNTIKVRAQGDHLVVTLNGKVTADVHEGSYAKGRIGFQIHAGDQFATMQISVRKMVLKPL